MSAVRYMSRGNTPHITRTISITSGKGGVGKSSIVSNLAYELGRNGKKVLILDGDLSMANVDIMFGMRAEVNVQHVLEGRATIDEVILPVANNVSLLPGGSGILSLQNISDFQKRNLMDAIQSMPNNFDYLLIDTAPGIADMVLYLNAAAHEVNVVVTPDPSSLTDSYALIKVLNHSHKLNKFNIICNQVRDEEEGMQLFKRLSDVAARFLFVSLDYRGCIPTDGLLKKATKNQQLVLETQPLAPSSEAIRKLAKSVGHSRSVENLNGGVQFFWEQILGVA